MPIAIRCRFSGSDAALHDVIAARARAAVDRFDHHLRGVEVCIDEDGPLFTARVVARPRDSRPLTTRSRAGEPVSAAHLAVQRMRAMLSRRREKRRAARRLAA